MASNNTPPYQEDELKIPKQAQAKTGDHHGLFIALGAIIVLLIISLAGLYFWSTTLDMESDSLPPEETTEESGAAATTDTTAPEQSTATAEFAAELEAIDFNELDAELEAMSEAEADTQ